MTADRTGTHEAVDASLPRQRDAGVMGYVAELQQFDDSMTAQDHAAEPPTPSHPDRGHGGHGSPATGAPFRVSKKQGRPPWSRTEVGLAVAFVLVAAVAIVGGAYAVLMASRPPTGAVRLPLPPVETAGEQGPTVSAEPTQSAPGAAGPSAEPTPDAAPSGGADPSTGDGAAAVSSAPPTPEASSAPPVPADLVARYSREANTGLLGLTGYRGQVTIANQGKGAADGWTVTLSLPTGQKVDSVTGADARQEGELVTFTPLPGNRELVAGGSVAFTFEVPGLLAGEPTGCAINGRSCSS
ncbi:hypothetical protein GCM10022251_59750 [Phytohabitans flavus]|uniref:CBM2 domain-containing protein n=1 Tax=Phytohabitans flavus TaxID=1076124 RepID=A0A6F8XY26_9ACTN|nr:cellulose binding domain-containing protein [Phytohabitans flavus]BCB78638.1 hypothetical protein Pflav_050480 [Phytohabitans flavus]